VEEHDVVWRTARPLWPATRGTGHGFEEPAVLRFAGDDFMEQFEAAVSTGAGLGSLVAGRETWDREGAGLGTGHDVGPGEPITLFQPVHGRFYLTTASLVCRRYGHPDRRVAADRGETVTFLLRRLAAREAGPVDPSEPGTFVELGWVSEDWVPVPPADVHEGERRHAVFSVSTTSGESSRRLYGGLIPVSGREALTVTPALDPSAEVDPGDPLAPLADERLRELEPIIVGLQHILTVDPADEAQLPGAQESLFFAMVDLGRWLERHLEDPLAPGSTVLGLSARPFASTDWRRALATVLAHDDDATGAPPLVEGLGWGAMRDAIRALGAVPAPGPATATGLFRAIQQLDLRRPAGPEPAPPPPGTGSAADGIYVVRFVYERPRCAPAQRHLLSRASRPFRLAGFHEPDAPARPVRIALPVDPSPGGLRRFPKNVSVVLSSELRKQMARVGPETLRSGDLATPPRIDLGMVCQLSIPIITICALILLMVIVQILNIVFFWLPLFKICRPVPKGGGR
jgi:hypothetical protein